MEVIISLGIIFLPIYGLIWLGIRRERLEYQRMLDISIRRQSLRNIASGRWGR